MPPPGCLDIHHKQQWLRVQALGASLDWVKQRAKEGFNLPIGSQVVLKIKGPSGDLYQVDDLKDLYHGDHTLYLEQTDMINGIFPSPLLCPNTSPEPLRQVQTTSSPSIEKQQTNSASLDRALAPNVSQAKLPTFHAVVHCEGKVILEGPYGVASINTAAQSIGNGRSPQDILKLSLHTVLRLTSLQLVTQVTSRVGQTAATTTVEDLDEGDILDVTVECRPPKSPLRKIAVRLLANETAVCIGTQYLTTIQQLTQRAKGVLNLQPEVIVQAFELVTSASGKVKKGRLLHSTDQLSEGQLLLIAVEGEIQVQVYASGRSSTDAVIMIANTTHTGPEHLQQFTSVCAAALNVAISGNAQLTTQLPGGQHAVVACLGDVQEDEVLCLVSQPSPQHRDRQLHIHLICPGRTPHSPFTLKLPNGAGADDLATAISHHLCLGSSSCQPVIAHIQPDLTSAPDQAHISIGFRDMVIIRVKPAGFGSDREQFLCVPTATSWTDFQRLLAEDLGLSACGSSITVSRDSEQGLDGLQSVGGLRNWDCIEVAAATHQTASSAAHMSASASQCHCASNPPRPPPPAINGAVTAYSSATCQCRTSFDAVPAIMAASPPPARPGVQQPSPPAPPTTIPTMAPYCAPMTRGNSFTAASPPDTSQAPNVTTWPTASAIEAPAPTSPPAPSALPRPRAPLPDVYALCPICDIKCRVNDMWISDCSKGTGSIDHKMCIECGYNAVSSAVEGRAIPACPLTSFGQSCGHHLGQGEAEQVVTLYAGLYPSELSQSARVERLTKVAEIYLQDATRKIPGVVLCPGRDCKWAVLPSGNHSAERIDCHNCHISFCSACHHTPYHYQHKCTCDELLGCINAWQEWVTGGKATFLATMAANNAAYQELLMAHIQAVDDNQIAIEASRQRAAEYNETEIYKQENCRLCPNPVCRKIIEHLGGCDLIKCGGDYHGGNTQHGCGHTFRWSQQPAYVADQAKATVMPLTAEAPQQAAEQHHFVMDGIPEMCDECNEPIVGPLTDCINCPTYQCCLHCQDKAINSFQHAGHVFKIRSAW